MAMDVFCVHGYPRCILRNESDFGCAERVGLLFRSKIDSNRST